MINSIAGVVNSDPQVNRYLRVAFFPNFTVKNAHDIYPAADLSEQISLAGKEASGVRFVDQALMIGGGVTLEAAGSIVGGIGVSGAPGGAADDACARVGIAAIQADLEF